ncbi:hypothetical protein B7767_44060 [Streptomyces sp. 13-12-16]|nr:hypothetical protein B7767_44060 [Streptomyces sp. 13-12-16]
MEQDALAEEFEACAAGHLALEHLDPVDMAFDDPGVPRLRESGSDGVEAALQVPAKRWRLGRSAAVAASIHVGSWWPCSWVGMQAKKRTCSASASSSGQLADTASSWSRSLSARASGWVRIQRVTAWADDGRGPTGLGLPRRFRLT